MKTTSCITLFTLTLSAVSADHHSIHGNKITNDAASHFQGVSELLHLPVHHATEATDSSFDEAKAIQYTDEELNIAAESAKNFLGGRGPGMEMTRPQSSKYTDEELEIAAESAKQFLKNKDPHTTQPIDDTNFLNQEKRAWKRLVPKLPRSCHHQVMTKTHQDQVFTHLRLLQQWYSYIVVTGWKL